MMGEDGKPFKTRSGGTVKLIELLDEAEERAFQLVSEKNPDLDDAARRRVALAVGIGAVKYADLSKTATAITSSTGTRCWPLKATPRPICNTPTPAWPACSARPANTTPTPRCRSTPPKKKPLAVALAQFNDVLYHVADEGYPHFLCQYLYQVSTLFMRFYEACPVLKSEGAVRASRL